MNFGIIGAGSIAGVHAKAISEMEGHSLHSVISRRPEGADSLKAEYAPIVFTDLKEFLADENLDVVTICTPSGAHGEAAKLALLAGKHVLVEKPLEVTTERIDQLMHIAGASEKTLACILNRRFNPAMDAAKKAMSDGRLGTMTSASCYVKWFRDQAYYDSADWRGTWALDGGGCLMNQGIHAIDSLIHLAGPVRAVRGAAAGRLAHTGIEVEDTACAVIEFESGACGVIEGSTCSWSKNGHPARIQLTGNEGSIFMADEAFEVWEFKDETSADDQLRQDLMKGAGPALGAADPKAISYEQHQRNFEEVVAAIEEGREPATSAAEGRKSVAVIEAIYRSAQSGGQRMLVK